jgi:acetylornithine deacetylase/succinyl-diaminopimelate desuccinylase-like protein
LSANPAATSRETTLVSAVEAAIEAETGRLPTAYEWHSASDIRFPILCHNLPAVGFGPLAGGFYGPHEWVEKASIHQTTAVLARLIAWWNDAEDDAFQPTQSASAQPERTVE